MGYAHVYGAFNLAYGVGSTVGPIIGGQVYEHLSRGWLALCLLATGLVAVCTLGAFCYLGADPLLQRLIRLVKKHRKSDLQT